MAMIPMMLLCFATSSLGLTVRAADAAGFESFECYRDLCVSRRQFCSEREQRCKYCQPAHCVRPQLTPPQCASYCSELPHTTTTTVPATSSRAAKTSTASVQVTLTSSPGQKVKVTSVGSGGRSDWGHGVVISPGEFTLILVVGGVVLFTILTLVAAILYHVRRAASSARAARGGKEAHRGEEADTLLGDGWGSKVHGGVPPSASQSTVSSQSPKQYVGVGSQTQASQVTQASQLTQMDSASDPVGLPPYTARVDLGPLNQPAVTVCREGALPATADSLDATSMQHHKGYDYRLLAHTARPWEQQQQQEEEENGHLGYHGDHGDPAATWLIPPGQGEQQTQDTCPKSL